MPHFIIEEGNALTNARIRKNAIKVAIDCGEKSGIMNVNDIKIRIHSYSDFYAVDGCKSFMHITVKLLKGRSTEQKEGLSILLRDSFAAQFSQIESISVDIRDMDSDTYKKRLLDQN